MRQKIFFYLIVSVIFISTSCSNKQYQVLFQQKHELTDSLSQKDVTVIKEYRIKPQDILQVRNLQDRKYIINDAPANANITTGNITETQTFQVDEDGTVILPVIGHVQVAGLTRSEAQKVVEDTYRKKLLVDPIIELKIVNLKVTMLGEIKGAGNYPLTKEHTTLVEMIGAAGGLTEKANETQVKIIRGTQKNPQVTIIDLSNIQSINDPRAILQNGDIIYFSQNKRATRSDNLSSFSVIIQPTLILFSTVLLVLTLIRR